MFTFKKMYLTNYFLVYYYTIELEYFTLAY